MSTALFSTLAERLATRENVPQRNTEFSPLMKRTCRNLFGPVNHDELKRELTSKLREISERDQLRWNFNFSEGQPMDGDLKWEERPEKDCPEFYRETSTSKRPFVDLMSKKENSQAAVKCGGHPVKILNQKNKCNRRKLARKTAQTKRLADMRITDFYGKRKKMDIIHKESE